MTYLASAAGFLIGERNTWESRADSAWGASRNWPDGISWEADRNNWYNQANAWYTSRYNDGYSAGNTAGYAAGDAAGRAAVMPAGSGATAAFGSAAGGEPANIGGGNGNYQTVSLQGIANSVLTFWTTANTITCPATGLYAIGMKWTANGGGTNAHRCSFRLLKNGSPSVSGLVLGTTESNVTHESGQLGGWHCLVSANAGETFQIQAYHSWGVSNTSFMCVFVSTPTHPH